MAIEPKADDAGSFVRVGIVGGGFIGRTVGGQLRAAEHARVAALVDIDEGTLESTGDALGVRPDARYERYGTMLDEEDLDAVLIGTPHTLHYEQVLAAMDHGLHVLCDKPLTTNLEDARDLVARDADREETLMVGYQRHLYRAFVEARARWLESGRVPDWITAEISQDWVDRFEGTWRMDPDLSGGGYLYDTGSHLLDSILWSTGLTPTAVAAEMEFVDDDRRVDGRSHVTVRFEEGTTASVTCSGETPCMREHIHLWDAEGATYLDSKDWEANTLVEIDAESGEHRPRLDQRDLPNKAEAFVSAVRHGEEPPATALDGLRVTAVTEAAYESARAGGEFVAVDPGDVALDGRLS
ncbi:Gfo/Idh/MocA family protein [Halalkalicoccus sp. NIPERK01]|uniref:Gfo/Idh/MocA family protein n=1 Tax=Halalkalicoccus sp. NIPERK01 TaxID=3053469 RepID=UPI00256F59E0|nr:Gfo/Idh/MocA family oxidoreductase [Halalkalicoccus sp. NIPERK01]MDL5360771.1 Gfo/Idh/MocA family oxidoreductase [Halalkalicoccus sp. NIPERK01]